MRERKTITTGLAGGLAALAVLGLAGCNRHAALPESATFGPHPTLVKPHGGLVPTVKIAKVVGWPAGRTPVAAPGLKVEAFATGLDHPRWILPLPNGDVLVAESNTPSGLKGTPGLRGVAERTIMGAAGAGVKSPDRIVLLQDPGGTGRASARTDLMKGLRSPFGMVLLGDSLYVADTDAILKVPFTLGQTSVGAAPVKVADLPAGDIDHHWTKNIIAAPDGRSLYATVGSNSNVGENGMENETHRAAILKVDLATGTSEVFASGLRNPNGMDFEPVTGALWTAVNERDEIGDDLVPDYMTSVTPGAFYGWPYSYYGSHVDVRPKPQRPDLVARAIAPDYALGAHTASLGLVFYRGDLLPSAYHGGVFIGQHGSWNRSVPTGYKVIFIRFRDGHPVGLPQDVLSGFLDDKGQAMGRPVGVAVDHRGALLVADDVGGVIWRVTPAAP